eukprot:10189060-Prorocentrum_lima.AAC.1
MFASLPDVFHVRPGAGAASVAPAASSSSDNNHDVSSELSGPCAAGMFAPEHGLHILHMLLSRVV